MPRDDLGMAIPITIASGEPLAVRAGETVTWQRELPEFSATDGWSLKYRLIWRAAGITPVEITAVGAGSSYTVRVEATTTANWAAGEASLWAYVERTTTVTERVSLQTTALSILPNLLTATSADDRSSTRRTLDDLRAALDSYSGERGHVQSYTIGDRTMAFRSSDEILKLITYYERQLLREQIDRLPRVRYRAG